MNVHTLIDLRQQLQGLEARWAVGTLGAEAFATERERLREAIIACVMAPTVPPPPVVRPSLRLVASCAALVLTVAAGGYAWKGSPQAWNPTATAPAADPAIVAMVERLAQRLRTQPDDIEGWIMLGRSMTVLERHDAAAQAYGQALALRPGDETLRALQAQALSRAAPPAPARPAAPR